MVQPINPPFWQANIARGRAFEREVREKWRAAGIWSSGQEQLVRTGRGRPAYIDLWDDANGILVICELKDVDWGVKRDQRTAMKAVQRHKNQVWKYLLAEGMPEDVQLVIIYSRTPPQPGWSDAIEGYFQDWTVEVVWWDSNPAQHWLRPPDGAVAPVGSFPVGVSIEKARPSKAAEREKAKIIERVIVHERH